MPGKAARALTIIFIVLTALNLAYLAAGFLSIPRYYERVTTLTIIPVNNQAINSPTNETVQRNAQAHEFSLAQYAVEQIVFHSGITLLCLFVAGMIMFRARWNWFAWFTASLLTFIAEYAFFNEIFVAQLLPIWVYEVGSLFWPLVLLYIYLFPNGNPTPRWSLWVMAPVIVIHLAVQVLGFLIVINRSSPSQILFDIVLGPIQGLISLAFLFILGCQIYRYSRVSTREEKQQTKWFLMGLLFFILLSSVSELLGDRNPYQAEISLLIFIFVPISVAFAILRYRLWDIDLVIRRTLQYGLLTAFLGLVYFGGVTLLQSVFTATAGQQSPLAVVLSTLVIAILFTPLRRGLQTVIDRRFYRHKYDAGTALERFSQNLRAQVDLPAIQSELLRVVTETVQPVQVTLWIREEKKNDPH